MCVEFLHIFLFAPMFTFPGSHTATVMFRSDQVRGWIKQRSYHMRDCLDFMTFSVHPHGIFNAYAVTSQTPSLQCSWFILSISQIPDPIICFSGYFSL